MQFGILRYTDTASKKTLQVQTAPGDSDEVHCMVTNAGDTADMTDRDVNLIQKQKDDYLYISGKVSAEAGNNAKFLSIRIIKACWFERRTKGKVTWLQEKFIYENYPEQELELAS